MIRLVYSYVLKEYIKLPDTVAKVASLNPSISEVIIELGLSSKLSLVSSLCRVLGRSKDYPELLKKPVLGDYVGINPRLARSVDLVLLSSDVQRNVISTLRSVGTSYFMISPPRSIWCIGDFIVQVATALNEVSKGIELANEFSYELNTLIKEVRPTLSKLLSDKLVYVELDLGATVIPGLFTHIITGLEALGIHTVNSRIYESYVVGDKAFQLSKELVTTSDIVIYEPSRYLIEPEEIINRLVMRGANHIPEKAIVTEPLSLVDYGPKFIETLKYIVKELMRY